MRTSTGASVVHLVTSTGFAGIERHVVALASEQRAQGWAPVIACPPGAANLREEARRRGLDVLPATGRGPLDRAWVVALGRALHRAKPAVLHVHDGRSALIGAALGPVLGCTLVRTQHFVHTASQNRGIAARRASLAVHRAANHPVGAYIAVSQSVLAAARARGELGDGTVAVIPPAIELPDVARYDARRTDRAAGERPVVAFAGRLEAERALDTLIAAVPMVLDALPTCRFILAGAGGAESALRTLAEELGVAGAIEWPGWVSDTSVVLTRADVYVNTWADEAFGMAMAEAMGLGLPAVAVDAGANPELVDPGVTGSLVPPRDAHALAGAIVDLLADTERLGRMGEAARRRVADIGSAATTAATIALYRRAIEAAA